MITVNGKFVPLKTNKPDKTTSKHYFQFITFLFFKIVSYQAFVISTWVEVVSLIKIHKLAYVYNSSANGSNLWCSSSDGKVLAAVFRYWIGKGTSCPYSRPALGQCNHWVTNHWTLHLVPWHGYTHKARLTLAVQAVFPSGCQQQKLCP